MTFQPSRRSVLRVIGATSIVSGAVVSGAAVAAGRDSGSVPPGLRPGGELDRLVAQLAAEDTFSGTVLVTYRGRTVLSLTHGMADKETSTPNQADTIFNLASITKSLTGLAISHLASREKVAYHEKLGTYLDGFPAEVANTVTIHQLLTHTSGVGRPATGSNPPSPPEWDSVEKVFDGTMAIIRQTPPRFPPGTVYEYSNDGYWVLGAIVAAVSGQPFFEYVREHILTPAGMADTDFYTRHEVLADPRIARPYWTQPSGVRVDFTTTPYFGFVGGPDTGAYSTTGDLHRYVTALREGKLLDPDFLPLAAHGGVPVPPKSDGVTQWFVGYGFMNQMFGGRRIFGRSGSGPGRATNLDTFPDLDWVAIVLSNYDNDAIRPIVTKARELIGHS